MPAMAVQSSFARCLRTSSSTIRRPVMHHQTQSLPIRGRLVQLYQKSGYATNDSPDVKAREAVSSNAQGPSSSSSPSSSSPAATPTTSRDISSLSGNIDSTADETIKLAERMADIRDKMKELSRPAEKSRTTRIFFRSPQESMTKRSEQTAEEQLDKLLVRRPRYQERERQRQDSSSSASASQSSPLHHLETSTPSRLRPVNMKLGTKLGRQIFVQNDKGVDCAGAIRMLQITCGTNGVRRQANLQKFHIRRGQRRKDLKSQRWRKLFKFSFDETVKKIQRMRDQGW